MSAMHIVKDALLKARKSAEAAGEEKDGGSKPSVSPHVAMDFIRRALDAAAPWWQTQGAEPKNGERIVNSPVEHETEPTAIAAGKHMEAMQRKAGSRPPIGRLPDAPKGMDEALAMDGMAMDANDMAAAATQMISELEKHDRQHHHGQYTGGTCKLRDKVAQAAKNLGMSQKAVEKITKRTASSEAGGAPAPEVPAPDDSPEFKEFDELRKKIMAETKAAGEGKTDEEQKALVKEAMGKLRSARFDYLTKALKMSPSEAGACSEIAEKVENGSEVAKKVVEELPDEQKKIVESVTVTEETTGQEGGGDGGSQEQSDDKFADELKKQNPELAQMVDNLSKKFDGLNDSLSDEQKKQFFDLQENGTDEEFMAFLESDACGFTKDETAALQTLMDGYRAANPDQFPEYAEQHKYDDLLKKVKRASPQLISDIKKGKNVDIKSRLETVAENNKGNLDKQFSQEEIADFMRAMGKSEDEIVQAMQPEDDPVEKGTTPEDHAKVCKANPKSNCPFLKSHMTPEQLAELDKPTAAQKVADLAKGTDLAKHVNDLVRRLDDNSKEAKDVFWDLKENLGDKISDDDIKALLKEKGYSDDQILAGEMGVPMPPKEMTPEEKKQKELDNAFTAAKEAYEKATGEEDRKKAWDALKAARKAAEDFKKNPVVEEQAPESGEPSEEAKTAEEPETETSEANEVPPPLPIPPEPLPEYKPPKVGNSEVELDDDEKQVLDSLKQAYNDAPDGATREAAKQMYENFCAGLDQKAAMLQAAHDIEADEKAQAEEKNRPGFIQNMKDFFGGIAKSMKGDDFVDLSDTARDQLGLPKDGKIRRSELQSALAQKARESQAKNKTENSEKGEYIKPLQTVDKVVLADASLIDPPSNQQASVDEAKDFAERIKDELNKKGMDVKSIESVNVGPSATSVEMKIGDGFDIDKAKHMIQNLARTGVKVTSIDFTDDGKQNTIKVDFGNRKMQDVKMADVLASDEWKTAKDKPGIPVAIGKDSAGKPIVKDISKMPHTLITGATKSGKSVCLQSLINSAQMAKTPKQLRQVCIDGKGQEFGFQEGSPYNLYPVAKSPKATPKDVARILESLQHEMEERAAKLGVSLEDYDESKNEYNGEASRNLDDYNARQTNEDEQMPYIATYIDELATYSKDPEYGKKIIASLDQLLAKGRSVGMNFVMSSQGNDVDSVPNALQKNIPGRIMFKAAKDDTNQKSAEAKKLAGYGDMIMVEPDGTKTRGRGVYLSDKELTALQKHYLDQVGKGRAAKETSTQAHDRPSKPSSPSHVGNTTDGMEIHKSPDGKIFFKRNGRQYKRARLRRKDGSVIDGWKLADGSDPRIYTFAPQR